MQNDWHQALTEVGCTIDTLADVRVVASVRSQARGLDRVAAGAEPVCGDLSALGWIEIHGKGSRAFLQGYITADLPPGGSVTAAGAIVNIKGRCIASVLAVSPDDDHVLLRCHRSVLSAAHQMLQKYGVFARVQIDDIADRWCGLGTFSPASPATPATEPADWLATDEGDGLQLARADGLREHWLPLDGARALLSAEQERLVDADTWAVIDVRAGYPEIAAGQSERFLPQMLDMHKTGRISFTKGCYLGQEVVARAQHRGELKRGLVRGAVTTPDPGSSLIGKPVESATRKVGEVVAAGAATAERVEFLAVMTLSAANEPLRIEQAPIEDVVG